MFCSYSSFYLKYSSCHLSSFYKTKAYSVFQFHFSVSPSLQKWNYPNYLLIFLPQENLVFKKLRNALLVILLWYFLLCVVFMLSLLFSRKPFVHKIWMITLLLSQHLAFFWYTKYERTSESLKNRVLKNVNLPWTIWSPFICTWKISCLTFTFHILEWKDQDWFNFILLSIESWILLITF